MFGHPTLASVWFWPLNSKTGYLRPLNYENHSFLTIGLFWWVVLLTWTPRGSGAHLSVLPPLSSLYLPLSLSYFVSPLSSPSSLLAASLLAAAANLLPPPFRRPAGGRPVGRPVVGD